MDESIARQILDKQEGFLRRHLVLTTGTIDGLFQTGIISHGTRRDLQKQNEHYQITTLIRVLQRNLYTLHKFLTFLQSTLDRWIAEAVLDTKITFTPQVPILEDKTLREHLKEHIRRERSSSNSTWNPTHVHSTRSTLQSNKKAYAHRNVSFYDLPMHRTERVSQQLAHQMVDERLLWPIKTQMLDVTHQVYHLHGVFETQKKSNEKTLSVLRQEQNTIVDILSKNLHEQGHLKKNQQSISEINKRLAAIHLEAGELLRPKPEYQTTNSRFSKLQNVITFDE